MNMLDQLQFGLCRTHHQNLLRALQRFHDGVVIVAVLGLASWAHGAAFGVQVQMRLGGVNHGLFHVIRTDVHDVRLGVIEPDNGVVVGHVELSC